MSFNLKEVFTKEEIRELTAKSDWMGAWSIFRIYLIVGTTFALLGMYPHPLTFILAVIILGGQQLACAILTHEAAHKTLFRNRWMNEVLADWLCARPTWTDVERYRLHHIAHHTHTGTDKDPDMSLVTPFPGTRTSLMRKFFRDLNGQTGVRRIIGLIGMDVGILKYTVAAEVERLPQEGRTWRDYLREGIKNMGPMILTNMTMVAVLSMFGIAWVYSAWLIAYLTTFSLFIRIRSIAEHACTEGGPDMLKNTRTTYANWLARLTVAPMNVNYHIEHHVMASVPYYRLPKLHKKLLEKGLVKPAKGYAEVLRLASAKPA